MSRKLLTARSNIAAIADWQDHTHQDTGDVFHVRQFVLDAVRDMLPAGHPQTPMAEVVAHFIRHWQEYGNPTCNPAMFEKFVGPSRRPLYFATVDGEIYVTSKPLFSF